MNSSAKSRMGLLGTLLGFTYGLALSFLALWAAGAGHGTYLPLGVSSAPVGVLGVLVALLCTPILWAVLGGLAGAAAQEARTRLVRYLVVVHYVTAILIVITTEFGGENGHFRYVLETPPAILVGWGLTYLLGQVALWWRLGWTDHREQTV